MRMRISIRVWSRTRPRDDRAGWISNLDVPLFRAHPLEPRLDAGEFSELEAAFFGHMRVGVKSDVRDRGAAAYEKAVGSQVPLHHSQGVVPPLHFVGKR